MSFLSANDALPKEIVYMYMSGDSEGCPYNVSGFM